MAYCTKNACMCKDRKDDGYEFQKKKKKNWKTETEQGGGVSDTACLDSGYGSLCTELEKTWGGRAHGCVHG